MFLFMLSVPSSNVYVTFPVAPLPIVELTVVFSSNQKVFGFASASNCELSDLVMLNLTVSLAFVKFPSPLYLTMIACSPA